MSTSPALSELHAATLDAVERGATPDEAYRLLIERGVDRDQAKQIVIDVEDIREGTRRQRGTRNMIIGGVLCVGGTIFAVVSANTAGPGDTVMMPFGAIVVGACLAVYGFIQRA